jgi:hypothetical protein
MRRWWRKRNYWTIYADCFYYFVVVLKANKSQNCIELITK